MYLGVDEIILLPLCVLYSGLTLHPSARPSLDHLRVLVKHTVDLQLTTTRTNILLPAKFRRLVFTVQDSTSRSLAAIFFPLHQ